MTTPEFRKPTQSPSSGAKSDLVRWDALARSEQKSVVAAAQAWRNGLAGFVALLTSVLILQGPAVADIAGFSKFAIIGLLVAGVIAALVGLRWALEAESPPQRLQDFESLTHTYHSIARYESEMARQSNARLTRAKQAVSCALFLLLAGMVCWWVAPTASAQGNVLTVVIGGDTAETICGESLAAPDGTLLLRLNNDSAPRLVELSSVDALTVADSCDGPAG